MTRTMLARWAAASLVLLGCRGARDRSDAIATDGGSGGDAAAPETGCVFSDAAFGDGPAFVSLSTNSDGSVTF